MSDQGENPHCSTISCMLYTSCILLSRVTRLIRTTPSLVPRGLVNVMRLDEIHTAVSSHIYIYVNLIMYGIVQMGTCAQLEHAASSCGS